MGEGEGLDRRTVLAGAITLGPALTLPTVAGAQVVPIAATPLERAPDGNRRWLGPALWANRLQDWTLRRGWIECTRHEGDLEGRTVGILTRELVAGNRGRMETTIAAEVAAGRGGFGGFLIGVGGGRLPHLAAAMAQRGSGRGGGLFAVVDADGHLAFREHSSETDPLAYSPLKAEQTNRRADLAAQPARLVLTIERAGRNRSILVLSLIPESGGPAISTARLAGVPDDLLLGGVSLVSSPASDTGGARFRFVDVATGGDRIATRPERALGPCLGCVHSVADRKLKLVAHFAVLGDKDDRRATLEARPVGGGGWRRVATASVGRVEEGSCALFEVHRWDAAKDWEYRVAHAIDGRGRRVVWSGRIRRDPVHGDRSFTIAMQGCVLSTQHPLEGSPIKRIVPQERNFGRYEPENFNFPHRDIADNSAAHDPDLVFFSGDQYYEHNPTRHAKGSPDMLLDTLARWQQWVVSFADLCRDRPAIVLVDDHDVLQGNLWGNGGREAPQKDQNQGGYAWGIPLAKMVYRMQCGANPDPIDPTPLASGLPVSFTAFVYGGTSIAVIEDRKWKTSAVQGEDMDVHVAELLGPRQERFLAQWKDMHPGKPKVLLTQALWACLQTSPNGKALLDFDSNAYPPLARRRAVKLAADARCVMLSGDQHLASLVRHGLDTHVDGPLQFTGPAGGTFWQRWFEPQPPLANQRDGQVTTGDFNDAFGHPMRVLAVANPAISFMAFRKHNTGRMQAINDRALKAEGYGIVRFDHQAEQCTFECWRWDKGPASGPAGQYPGWPYSLRYQDF